MTRLRLIAALAAALLPACSAPAEAPRMMTWLDLLSRPQPSPDKTVSYGADSLQVVDLWLPTGAGPHRTVLMIHGGCWKTSIADRKIMNWIADDLRKRGIAVWNIDYRGVDRKGGGYPGTYEDVAAAADLLAKDGAKYGLKTDKLLAIGHSAGGHLSLWLSARTKLPAGHRFHSASAFAPGTVISQGGIPDLRDIATNGNYGCGPEGAKAMAGDPPAYAETSPPEMKPGPAKLYQVNGDGDRIAPPRYAASFNAAMKAKGVKVTDFTILGSGHVELIAPGTAAWTKQVELIEAGVGR